MIAWHGLARTGRDMDELAQHLSARFRVICPDTVGRGLSQWSADPGNATRWASSRLSTGVSTLRGADSDLVLPDATQEMLQRGPGARGLARVVEVQGCGHAPALNVPAQLDLVASFIEQHETAANRQPRASARPP